MTRADGTRSGWEADLGDELRAMFRERAADVRVDEPPAVSPSPAEAAARLADVRAPRPARRRLPALLAAGLAVIGIVALVVVAVSGDDPSSVDTPATQGTVSPPVVNDSGETVRRIWHVEHEGRAYTIEQVSLPGQGDRVGFNLVLDGRRVMSASQRADCPGTDPGAHRVTPLPDGALELAGVLPRGATGVEVTFSGGESLTVDAFGAPDLPVRFFHVVDVPGPPDDVAALGVTEPLACE